MNYWPVFFLVGKKNHEKYLKQFKSVRVRAEERMMEDNPKSVGYGTVLNFSILLFCKAVKVPQSKECL